MLAQPPRVDIYVDPVCPFAWLATRWPLEVERYRDIDLRFHLMSPWMLDGGRDVPRRYRQLLDRSPGPSRVARSRSRSLPLPLPYGEPILRDLYSAMGGAIFHPDHSTSSLTRGSTPRSGPR